MPQRDSTPLRTCSAVQSPHRKRSELLDRTAYVLRTAGRFIDNRQCRTSLPVAWESGPYTGMWPYSDGQRVKSRTSCLGGHARGSSEVPIRRRLNGTIPSKVVAQATFGKDVV